MRLTQTALAAAFLSDANARFFMGSCPKPISMQNLDINKYQGMWYGIEADAMFPFTLMPSSCSFKKFTPNKDGNLDLWFGADSWPMGKSGVNGELFCDSDKFVQTEKETCEANMAGKNQHKPFAVLATDYENYDVGYYCMELIPGFFASDIAMIYSRE